MMDLTGSHSHGVSAHSFIYLDKHFPPPWWIHYIYTRVMIGFNCEVAC